MPVKNTLSPADAIVVEKAFRKNDNGHRANRRTTWNSYGGYPFPPSPRPYDYAHKAPAWKGSSVQERNPALGQQLASGHEHRDRQKYAGDSDFKTAPQQAPPAIGSYAGMPRMWPRAVRRSSPALCAATRSWAKGKRRVHGPALSRASPGSPPTQQRTRVVGSRRRSISFRCASDLWQKSVTSGGPS